MPFNMADWQEAAEGKDFCLNRFIRSTGRIAAEGKD